MVLSFSAISFSRDVSYDLEVFMNLEIESGMERCKANDAEYYADVSYSPTLKVKSSPGTHRLQVDIKDEGEASGKTSGAPSRTRLAYLIIYCLISLWSA